MDNIPSELVFCTVPPLSTVLNKYLVGHPYKKKEEEHLKNWLKGGGWRFLLRKGECQKGATSKDGGSNGKILC